MRVKPISIDYEITFRSIDQRYLEVVIIYLRRNIVYKRGKIQSYKIQSYKIKRYENSSLGHFSPLYVGSKLLLAPS